MAKTDPFAFLINDSEKVMEVIFFYLNGRSRINRGLFSCDSALRGAERGNHQGSGKISLSTIIEITGLSVDPIDKF